MFKSFVHLSCQLCFVCTLNLTHVGAGRIGLLWK